jgi:hypothetical protein
MFAQRSLIKEMPRPFRVAMPVLQQERELMRVATEHHWPFRVMGVAPVPAEPVFLNNWWLIPIAADHSQIPTRALERVQAIYEAGIRPKAFVIAHEAPKQLPAPRGTPIISPLEFWSKKLAEHSLTALKVIGVVFAAVVPVLITILGVGAMAAVGLAGVLMTDPCLIAVTDDDVWVLVDYWMA